MENRAGGRRRINLILLIAIVFISFISVNVAYADSTSDLCTNPSYASASSTYLYRYPSKAFDDSNTSYAVDAWESNCNPSTSPQWLMYDFHNYTTVINKYTISAAPNFDGFIAAPINWIFQGSNDLSTWSNLHTVSNATWSSGEKKIFTFSNNNTYRYYRIYVTANGDTYTYLVIGEMEMMGYANNTPPAAPTNLTATATSYNQVQLSWQPNTEPDLAGYIIYRDYVEIARVGSAETSYTDGGLNPDTTYTYGVKAYNTYNVASDISNAVTVKTSKPPAPSGLTVSNITATGAKATWNAVAGANSYNIYLDGNPIYNTTSLQYDLYDLSPGTTYTIEVRTVVMGVESDPVTPLNFTTLSGPAAPKGLTATAISYDKVQLTWQANTEPDLAGYIIYRDYVEIARVGATETSYTDSGLQPDTTYTYGIMAYNTALLTSGMSNAATVRTQALPKPVLTVRVDNRTINMSWTGTADSILIMVNDQQVASTAGNQYSYYAQPGTYKVQVIAVTGEYQQASDPVNVLVSQITMPGGQTMVSDILNNAGMVLYPAGGLLALALALKGSPWVVAAAKAVLLRRFF